MTPEERLACGALALTYVFYAAGALYLTAPATAWLLMLLLTIRFASGAPLRRPGLVPLLWIGAGAALLVALVIGHLEAGLSSGQMIKSILGWARGWAMFPLCILAGACLNIRPAPLARAANIVGLQTLLLTRSWSGPIMRAFRERFGFRRFRPWAGRGLSFFRPALRD